MVPMPGSRRLRLSGLHVCCLLAALAAASAHAQQTLPEAPRPATLEWPGFQPQQHRHPNPKQSPTAIAAESLPPTSAHQPDFWHRPYFLGDWGGERTRLANEGFTMDFYYVADALANPSGGFHPGGETWWGRIRGTVDVNLGKFLPDPGLTGHITSVWQYGTNIGGPNYVNSFANPSSLASQHLFRAAEYSLSQYLFRNHIDLRGGKLAAWNTYGTQEYGSSFLNEPMGYAFNTFANTYMTYDPGGTPAFELRVLPSVHYYAKAMVLSQEKKPYTQDPTGFGFHFGPPVVAAEAGFLHDPQKSSGALGMEDYLRRSETGHYPGIFKFGGSYNPGTFTNQLTGQRSPGNYVVWAQANQALYREPQQGLGEHRGLDATFTIDHSPNDVNQQNQQMDAGLRYIGPFRGHHFAKDMLDLGWVRTSDGSFYRRALLLQGKGPRHPENLAEINYLANLTPWLLLQPTAEFIVDPNATPGRGTVVVVGFRTMVTF